MKKQAIILSAVSAVLLVVTAVSLYFFLKDDKLLVPVASHTILPYTQIKTEDYYLIEIAEVKENIITDPEKIEGLYTKGQTTIYPNSFFFAESVEALEEMDDGPFRYLSKDEVAFDLFKNEVKINSSMLKEGMSIDLYLTVKDGDKIYSDLLFKGVHILARYDDQGKLIRDDRSEVETFTLRLERQDVSYLNKALLIGEISAVVSSEAYTDGKAVLNTDSEVIQQLLASENTDEEISAP